MDKLFDVVSHHHWGWFDESKDAPLDEHGANQPKEEGANANAHNYCGNLTASKPGFVQVGSCDVLNSSVYNVICPVRNHSRSQPGFGVPNLSSIHVGDVDYEVSPRN
jgi:hypothetical protein